MTDTVAVPRDRPAGPAAAPVLETHRLRLRMPSLADFDAEAAFMASDRARFVGGPIDREDCWRSFAAFVGHWTLRGYGFFAVTDRKSGAYLGRVGPYFPEGWPEPEIGWTLTEAAEGRDIAREAAVAARRFAYDELGWQTAISLIAPDNIRSRRLAERLGAAYERDFVHPQFGRLGVYRHPTPGATQ